LEFWLNPIKTKVKAFYQGFLNHHLPGNLSLASLICGAEKNCRKKEKKTKGVTFQGFLSGTFWGLNIFLKTK